MIDPTKKYRFRSRGRGEVIQIVSALGPTGKECSVVAEVLWAGAKYTSWQVYAEDGMWCREGGQDGRDLVEATPYDEFVIDQKVEVRDDSDRIWVKGHFAGTSSAGCPSIWVNGGTSWTVKQRSFWNMCRAVE